MKKFLFILVMVISNIIEIAHAHQWSGFYAGVMSGFTFNNSQLKSQHLGFTNLNNACNASANFSSFSPGIQFGYLYPLPHALVTGVEASFLVNTHSEEVFNCNSNINVDVYDRFRFRNQMATSLKGLVGRMAHWGQNIFLPFLTAGASFANFRMIYQNEGGDYYSDSATTAGWLIGFGIEWAFKHHWSLRAEYNYVNYGNAITLKIPSVYGLLDPNGSGEVNLYSNNIGLALHYWF